MVSSRAARGFTLVELMVVVALIAIFATVAVPSFTKFVENNRTQAAHNEVVGLLRYARTLAVTERTVVSVCTADNSLQVVRGTCDGSAALLRQLELPAAVSISADEDEVSFRPNGTAASANFATCYKGDHQNGFAASIEASGSIRSYARGQSKGGAMTTCDLS
ncbi:MAG: GspH/FimT family pseudopilin [Spongiibacteraceae bacterium]|jgi:type IV fimbrial biogenesis protein FimU|nr:GspH/FimT family pseudopilin [Spongiibacteraceae bacterium]